MTDQTETGTEKSEQVERIKIRVELPKPTDRQQEFLRSIAKRKVIRAGRRGGKTIGMSILAVEQFLKGHRILYGAPTTDQVDTFWSTVTQALVEPIEAGIFRKNETEHSIELAIGLDPKFAELFPPQTRIRAKTAWNAETLRGDWCDLLILDEWQMMNEDAWETVGAPMLLDNNGDAVFVYTPPSLHKRVISRARDSRHAAKLFKRALADRSGRWAAFHFTSHDNPHLDKDALAEISQDMTALALRQEILAEDVDEVPGALWKLADIEAGRVNPADVPDLIRVVVGVDPTGGAAEAGIVVAGVDARGHGYVLDDASLKASPNVWALKVVECYQQHMADRIAAEKNYGGEMVESTIRSVEGGRSVSVKLVQATRGKAVRAEPVAAKYERGLVHHVGMFELLEEEMCTFVQGNKSPNRMDALVWALTELMDQMTLTHSDLDSIHIEEMEAISITANY